MRFKKIIATMGVITIIVSGWRGTPQVHATEAGTVSIPAQADQQQVIDYTTYVDQVATLVETEDQKRYRSLCPAYDAGEVITLKSSADREAFVKYYNYSYDLLKGNSERKSCWYINETETYLEHPVGDYRAAVITATINKFGLSTEGDVYTIIRNTCSRVRSNTKYDKEYMYRNNPDSLVSGHAVCVHYAMAAYILLNAEGIPTRMVGGTRSGGGHQWNECFIDGTWVTVDFTSFANKNISPDGFVTADYLATYVEF